MPIDLEQVRLAKLTLKERVLVVFNKDRSKALNTFDVIAGCEGYSSTSDAMLMVMVEKSDGVAASPTWERYQAVLRNWSPKARSRPRTSREAPSMR